MTNEVITEREAFAEIERRQISIQRWITPLNKWTANCRKPVWIEASGKTALGAVANLLRLVGKATVRNRERVERFTQRPGYQSGMAKLEEMEARQ